MTIKWVQADPLVMNGEPFCYGTRLTVRNILEMRRSGYSLARMIKEHPELRRMGVAAAYAYAAANRPRYAECFAADGSLVKRCQYLSANVRSIEPSSPNAESPANRHRKGSAARMRRMRHLPRFCLTFFFM